MKTCYRCEIELIDSNITEEHVILNACGGRLKSKYLLCKDCNSIFGESFDKELALATNDLANLLLIKRHRGVPQPIKGKSSETGEDYFIEYGGSPIKVKPSIIKKIDNDKLELTISANDEKQFKSVIKGLKRKYPQLDIEEILKSAQRQKGYLDESINFTTHLGGKEVFKSITKTAIDFYMLKGGDRKYIKHLLPYLAGETDLDVVWMHYPDKFPYNPNPDEVSHVLRLIGDSNWRILYVYIELFNVHNYIIRLNSEYTGKDICNDYIFDVLKLQELNKAIDLNYNRTELMDIFDDKDGKPFVKVQRRFARVLQIADSRQFSNHQHELISRGVKNSLGKKPEGTIITEEMIKEMAKEVTKEMMPFIIHNLNIKGKQKK